MHKTDLNLTVFSRALASFKAALAEYNKDESNTYVRDSVIQRFEYCYDLSKKMLIRHLKNIGEDNIDSQSLADIIRLGAKKNILRHSWGIWGQYREYRNATTHGYHEHIAISIVSKLDGFSLELDYFLDKLQIYYMN